MLLSLSKAALVAVAWIILPFAAGAQSGQADIPPTGDVWITPQSQYLFGPRSGASPSANPELPLGDVWFTPNDVNSTKLKAPQNSGNGTSV